MTTPKSIRPKFFKKNPNLAEFNLKQIRQKIEQAIKEVTHWKPLRKHNFVTSTVTKHPLQDIEVTITVHRSKRPENGAGHQPRFVWGK
jgi:hypothetical protein